MPRNVSIAVENNFSKGLITEATGMNFPENACQETENCIFDKTGEVSRRLGVDFEGNHVPRTFNVDGYAITEFLWEGVAQTGEKTFVVVQIGEDVRFFNVDQNGSISSGLKTFSVHLPDFRAVGAVTLDLRTKHCSFAAGNGLLFIVHPHCDPVYVKYDAGTNPPTTEKITTTKIIVQIRDTDGLPNNYQTTGLPMAYNHRPLDSEFNQAIYYNLLNQGWYVNVQSTPQGRRWHLIPPLILWKKGSAALNAVNVGDNAFVAPRLDWPSEADIWHLYKGIINLTGYDPPAIVPPAELFSMAAVDQVDLGNTPAGKGHFILDAFNENRTLAANDEDQVNKRFIFANNLLGQSLGPFSSYAADPAKKTNITNRKAGINRPSQTAFYAGRAWYAGIDADEYNNKIYFTQIIEGTKNVERCYQSQDPTSEVSSDLLPSDGGVIVIPEIAKIVKLFVLGSSLLVFATNGIWKISGSTSEALGFTANDFSIVKLSTVGAISALSFVDAAGTPLWWNLDGIWTIQGDQTGGSKITSITNTTIQKYFDDLPPTEIRWVKGCYDPLTHIVQWLVRDTSSANTAPATAITNRYRYNIILNLDTTTGAFYPWRLSLTTPEYIMGIVNLYGTGTNTLTENVVDNNGEIVTDSMGNVTVTVFTTTDLTYIYKYLTYSNALARVTFSEFNNSTYRDWSGNIDYSSFFSSGYKLRGEGIRKYQSNYINIFTRNENVSVFDLFSKWDYAITGNKGRWSSKQRIQQDEPNDYSYQTKRLKIRGHGLALQFKVNSVVGQPFNVIGWSTWDSTNAAV